MPIKDKAKQAAAARRHYEKNRQTIIDRAAEYRREQRRRVREYIRAVKEAAPCADCGETYRYYVMHFDHTADDKEFNIGSFASLSILNLDVIKAEIAKCDLVCGNCHAERTYRRGQAPLA